MKLNENIIRCENLGIGHSSILHSGLDLKVQRGEFIVLIGENGKGKSTLLKTLAGNLPALEGAIFLDEKKLSKWNKKQLAEKLAVVWTDSIDIGLISVVDFVAFGRYPFTNWLADMSGKDREVIEQSIQLCGIAELKERDVQSLSDGEKQKVLIARAMAQSTEVIILDEPSTHLDIKNTAEVFLLLKKLSTEYKKSIILSTHKIEMALQIADVIWLMSSSEIIQDTAENLIEKGSIQKELLSDKLIFKKESNSFHLNIK